MGAALSFLGQKLFASSTLINARCENISCASGAQCCTSVAAVQSPIIRRTGGFLRKGMTTIYVDSRKRVAGSDSDFEVDLGESLHLQSDARLAVYKIRIADSFLSTDRGRYLYCRARHAELGAPGAYTGSRLAAWISSNFATAAYSETTNSLSVAYDGNRLILNDLELQQQFPNVVDYPTSPAASPSKPFSIDHMLGPSFVSGAQQVFEFVRMMAYNEVYLRCPQRVLGNLGDDILSKITLKSGVGTIVETGSDDGHFMAVRGPNPQPLQHTPLRAIPEEGFRTPAEATDEDLARMRQGGGNRFGEDDLAGDPEADALTNNGQGPPSITGRLRSAADGAQAAADLVGAGAAGLAAAQAFRSQLPQDAAEYVRLNVLPRPGPQPQPPPQIIGRPDDVERLLDEAGSARRRWSVAQHRP